MVDPEIIAIDQAMVAQSKSRADLGRLLGLDSSQVSRIFSGKRRLQRHEFTTVTQWLGLAPPPPAAVAGPGNIVPLPGMIALFGWGGPSSDQALALTDEHLRGYVPAHPHQSHVKDAFALTVATSDMSPRYEPGETIYLAPLRWPQRGQDCVVMLKSGEASLRRYLGRDDDGVQLEQLNPSRTAVVPHAEIDAIHSVVGRG